MCEHVAEKNLPKQEVMQETKENEVKQPLQQKSTSKHRHIQSTTPSVLLLKYIAQRKRQSETFFRRKEQEEMFWRKLDKPRSRKV